jgi:hypothetical protein
MATIIITKEPIKVSICPSLISLTVSPLSTTEDCWKNNIHGAMVVPRFARITYIKSELTPPGICHEAKLFATAPQWRCGTKKTSGIKTRLNAAMLKLIHSHVK